MSKRASNKDGVLLVDKPAGITSHDAVVQVRRLIGQRRVGHTGTLDPEADGLLVMCLGRAAKVARFISDMDKTYEGTVTLGKSSSTFDAEGVDPEAPAAPIPDIAEEDLTAVLGEFEGEIKQKVPAYSAVRVDGQRLYDMARRGAEVNPPERDVVIKSLYLKEFSLPEFKIEVTCSKGTYIRSLAHDIGQRLGCGAYLSQLRRTAVGHLTVEQSVSLDELAELVKQEQLEEKLVRIEQALDYSAMLVENGFRDMVFNGRDLRAANVASVEGNFLAGEKILLKDSRGLALAVGVAEIDSSLIAAAAEESKLFSYVRVLN